MASAIRKTREELCSIAPFFKKSLQLKACARISFPFKQSGKTGRSVHAFTEFLLFVIYHKVRTYTLLPGTILSWFCFVRLSLLKNAGSLSLVLADLEETLKSKKK